MMKKLLVLLVLAFPIVASAAQDPSGGDVSNCCLPCKEKGDPTAIACFAAAAAARNTQETSSSGVANSGDKATAVDPNNKK